MLKTSNAMKNKTRFFALAVTFILMVKVDTAQVWPSYPIAQVPFNTVHLNESYGYLAVYMRLKGVTPPSSEK